MAGNSDISAIKQLGDAFKEYATIPAKNIKDKLFQPNSIFNEAGSTYVGNNSDSSGGSTIGVG